MKPSVILFSLFTMLACAESGNKVTIQGTLMWDETHHPIIKECNTNKLFQLGVMAANPYFHLTRKSDDLSQNGKSPVIVTVSGNINPSSNLIINQPNILNISAGDCS